MNIVAVMVGVGEWEKYTRAAIESVLAHDPDLKLVVVDNGGEQYPNIGGVTLRRYSQPVCYSQALNGGMDTADLVYEADWYVLLNNDILLHKPITPGFATLDPKVLYGFQYFQHPSAFPADYLASWAYFLPREIALSVGEFDENLKPMWFEDADYCIRTQEQGYRLGVLDAEDWGLEHLEKDRRAIIGKNATYRARNREYLLRKHNLCLP